MSVCNSVCACVHACMGSWLTFRQAVLLSLDYLAGTGSLAYLPSGHLCGQACPLSYPDPPPAYTDAHTATHMHTLTHHGGTATTVTFSIFSSFGTSFASLLPSFLSTVMGSKISSGGSKTSLDYLCIWHHVSVFGMISLSGPDFNSLNPAPTKPAIFQLESCNYHIKIIKFKLAFCLLAWQIHGVSSSGSLLSTRV